MGPLKMPPKKIIAAFNKDPVNSRHLSIMATVSVFLEWPLLSRCDCVYI